MTDDQLQPLYDILGEAFKAGQDHVSNPNGPNAGHFLFPLAARMEEELATYIDAERDICAAIASVHGSESAARAIHARQSLPSSPERETL
jgi:hypothetical protein